MRRVGRYLGVAYKKSINGNFGNRSKCLWSEVRNLNIQQNLVIFEILKLKQILGLIKVKNIVFFGLQIQFQPSARPYWRSAD